MMRKKKGEAIRHGPRQKEVRRFVGLSLAYLVVEFLFWISIPEALLLVLVLGGFVAARVFGFGFHVRGLWLEILVAALVVPLYYLRKNIERRFDEARYQLEQTGLPESQEDTNPHAA